MYLGLTIFAIQLSCCLSFVAYEIFQGFDVNVTTNSYSHSTTKKGKTTLPPPTSSGATLLPIKYPKFNCSKDEKPFNIGTYEVPTQRDVVLMIQKTLKRMYNRYQEKALDFLQDIREATKATEKIEKGCYPRSRSYNICVKRVSRRCEVITKSLVTSLEAQRTDVSAFIEGTICDVKEMKADPMELIKTLAMEQASLEFALPGFLRLLGACSIFCDKKLPTAQQKKPLRHMTDQDLVVKHFLTKKSYLQLLKASK